MKFASTATTDSFLKRPRLSHTPAPSSHPGRRLRHLFPSLLLLLSYLALLLRIADANDRPTLYAPGDNVLELDVNTFDKTVYHKPTAFFIEFYSSWCGHCIEYKPHYVRFATMLKDWRNAVVIGVINCADELNAPTCREHAIDGFPTLKYFHVNARGKDDAIKFDENKFDLPLMAKKITEWVKADFDKGLAPSSFPRLQFETDDKTLSSLWSSNAKPNAQLLAIVVDKEPATQAYSLLLNYAGDPRLGLALCSPSHPIVQARLADLPTPRLLVFSRSNPDQPVFKSEAPIESWLEMQKKLDELLAPYPKPEMPPLDSLKDSGKQGSAAIASAAAADAQKQEQPLVVNWNQFEVQYQDLVAALHYMLTVEVPRNPVLGSLELKTLKRFVHLIRQHGPGSVPARRLFFRLDEWLTAQQQPVVATDAYLGKLEEFQTDLGHPIPANVSYLACRGSKSYLRGYTCGLWTLFHLLTVQAYKERKDDPKFDSVSEVLEPIHQFIVQFLSCEACSKHFDKMASEDGLLNVHRPEDVVLWLWRAHNKVNTRLRGEASEDPKFPKQQFPPASLCSECRRGDGQLEEFDEQKVLQFMVRYYSDVKIDKYKPAPGYKVSEFANGKLEKVAHKKLNPKFEPMAGKVDRLEEIEAKMRSQQEAGLKRHWEPIEDDYRGIGESSNLHHIWLVLIAMALIVAYFQYRRNRSKFWKIFYYYNDYKVLPWQRDASTSTMNLDKYHA